MTDEEIRQSIEGILDRRQPSATICPSEVARALDPTEWRRLMPLVRAVAVVMAKEGALRISQAGNKVDLDRPFKGPIRLGRPHA